MMRLAGRAAAKSAGKQPKRCRMMDDKTRALLGDHEAAKRLTDAGVLLASAHCGKQASIGKEKTDGMDM